LAHVKTILIVYLSITRLCAMLKLSVASVGQRHDFDFTDADLATWIVLLKSEVYQKRPIAFRS